MFLRRADVSTFDTTTVKPVEKIQKACDICAELTTSLRRLKLTVGFVQLRLHHGSQVDTMILSDRPIMRMLDEATQFCAAWFLQNQSTSDNWMFIQKMSSFVYPFPSKFLIVDRVSAYTSQKMRKTVKTFGARFEEAPVQTPGGIVVAGRYQGPLRLVYERNCADTDRHNSNKECLWLAVFAVNCTVRLEGFVSFLVFWTIPRPAGTTPVPSELEQAKLVDRVTEEVSKELARRKIAFCLRH